MTQGFDSIIIGGGMVGMATAIALAEAGLQVAVIERIPPPDQLEATFDGRVSAIALGSKRLLRQIGVWDDLAPHTEPIEDIRVVDGDTPFFLHYDHSEVGDDPFGWIVENRIIRGALFARAKQLAETLALFTPASVESFSTEGGMARVVLEDGSTLSAPLLVAADGKLSRIRKQAGIETQMLAYDHTAIVCTISHSHPHHGLAVERFLPVGPFAVLPMQHNRSSLVWTEPHANIAPLLKLNDAELAAEITRRVGGHLGEIRVSGPRFTYPVTLVHATCYAAPRLALIGDAAHGIHPIAGQGVNLGFRDVAALAEVLVDGKRTGLDLGSETLLARYARWRSFDSLLMIAVTDGLTRLFSNDFPPVVTARRIGLTAVGKLPPLKRFFMRHAMGVVGDLPKLMRGEAL